MVEAKITQRIQENGFSWQRSKLVSLPCQPAVGNIIEISGIRGRVESVTIRTESIVVRLEEEYDDFWQASGGDMGAAKDSIAEDRKLGWSVTVDEGNLWGLPCASDKEESAPDQHRTEPDSPLPVAVP